MHLCFRTLVLGVFLFLTSSAHAILMIDQEHAPANLGSANAVANDRSQIQTFQVGKSGILSSVEVGVTKRDNTVEDLLLSLWLTDNLGLPDVQIANASLLASQVSLGSVTPFASFDLSSFNRSVSQGDLLAIILDSNASNAAPFDQRYLWQINEQYNLGTAYTRIGQNLNIQQADFYFRTFVDVPGVEAAVPEPSSIALLALGMAGILRRRTLKHLN